MLGASRLVQEKNRTMSSSTPRRAAGPLPESRSLGRGSAMALFSGGSGVVGLILVALGLLVLVDRNLAMGVMVAALGGILATIGVIGVIVGLVVMARGETDDESRAGDEDLAMVGSFVEDDGEDQTGIL
ncbi:hypothetical protein FB460_0625 [Propioniferax innocua]|uniref:Uncharacterized protein n=2 Tax=Propioniferax innocua TaxID=1753 RepID=A0A542ZR56_9ACTN|nr:hypothetical protein FB460_0625 [Propioniferax innocua]